METQVLNYKLNNLKEKGCENIIILPLYPQYAAATTATVCDEVYRSLNENEMATKFTNNTSLRK